MRWFQRFLEAGFNWTERWLDRIFSPAWNPLGQLGALGFYFLWVAVVSGVYLYIFFDTSIIGAFSSVEAITTEQWYAGGVMRSLHRYASDGMVAVMFLHMLREFALGRYRGKRWFSWITGLPVMVLLFAAGIGGYWLVWDKLAQYIAIATTEWLDWLPIFDLSIARNFLTPSALSDRFFTLLVFIHIAVPLILVLALWIHIQRMAQARINPARGLMIGTSSMLLVLSLIKPAVSQGGPADLSTVAAVINLDWFYLGLYPLLDMWDGDVLWLASGAVALVLVALPWLPPAKAPPPARVDLAHCNGCRRCFDDCPFTAITMQPRSDGSAFAEEAVVDPDLCVSCGICMGACPSSTPFRRNGPLVSGIELPSLPLAALREQTIAASMKMTGQRRILVFGCDRGVAVKGLEGDHVAGVSLPCVAALPPSFIDFVLSRDLADGVAIVGCAESGCYHRSGVAWMGARMARTRDPYLRQRVPRARLLELWLHRDRRGEARRQIEHFADALDGEGER